MTESMNMLVT